MKRVTAIFAIIVVAAVCSFSALYAGIHVGYALAVADGRVASDR